MNEKEHNAKIKSLLMALNLGGCFCNTPADTNDWRVRMIKASLGDWVIFPDDWDKLPEEEKTGRLNCVIDLLRN